MTDQTLSTEDVELLNILTGALLDAAQEDDNNFIPFTKRTHYAKAIMAHLAERDAARDREVAAKALRGAASLIGGDHGPRGGVRMADEVEWAQWLNACADRIGAGDE